MTNQVLVALDSSERATQVLAAAARIGERMGGKLLLLRAVSIPTELPSEAYAMSPDELVVSLRDRALREVTALAAAVGGPPVLVEVGTPWQVICRVARERDAALIVLGSHGFSGIDHVLGTTAAKVVNHADRSVLIVRAPELLV
jgi:nucleotide-binding universal stress UspA family protein